MIITVVVAAAVGFLIGYLLRGIVGDESRKEIAELEAWYRGRGGRT